ncbi:hypothetical protein HEB29_004782 [Streptomyces fulvorobeus]|uniref:Uncharacterized protein n=1 Tax=Streptomyces fulvorobeus TaxID=284028 RepID=A0A7Y9HGF5_9ACTN|nr:hypothetical protein [Streptomyces fulvorobeus]
MRYALSGGTGPRVRELAYAGAGGDVVDTAGVSD